MSMIHLGYDITCVCPRIGRGSENRLTGKCTTSNIPMHVYIMS
eukprot:SAG31_NODE_1352_length_8668_cov_38.573229_11_plen_42_part_01